jgi:hypothetical protein
MLEEKQDEKSTKTTLKRVIGLFDAMNIGSGDYLTDFTRMVAVNSFAVLLYYSLANLATPRLSRRGEPLFNYFFNRVAFMPWASCLSHTRFMGYWNNGRSNRYYLLLNTWKDSEAVEF